MYNQLPILTNPQQPEIITDDQKLNKCDICLIELGDEQFDELKIVQLPCKHTLCLLCICKIVTPNLKRILRDNHQIVNRCKWQTLCNMVIDESDDISSNLCSLLDYMQQQWKPFCIANDFIGKLQFKCPFCRRMTRIVQIKVCIYGTGRDLQKTHQCLIQKHVIYTHQFICNDVIISDMTIVSLIEVVFACRYTSNENVYDVLNDDALKLELINTLGAVYNEIRSFQIKVDGIIILTCEFTCEWDPVEENMAILTMTRYGDDDEVCALKLRELIQKLKTKHLQFQ